MRMMHWWISSAIVLSLGACGGAEPPAAAATDSTSTGSEAPPTSEALSQHMSANFRLAIDARKAIVDGDLAGAKAKATELAALDYKGLLPEAWLGGAAKMQAAARALGEAPNLTAAATELAKLASTCGDCHSQLGESSQDQTEHAKFAGTGSEDIVDRMARHQRGADEMWFGLSMPSEASWQEGGKVLSEAPETSPSVEGKPGDAALAAKMAGVRELGVKALAAKDTPTRIAVYGELLGQCAGCHGQ